MVLDMDLVYSYVPIQSTLSSVEAICKAKSCKVYRDAQSSIYEYLDTSSTTYESLALCYICRDKEIQRNMIEIPKRYTLSKYFITDSSFPFFRGLYCIRETFIASSGKTKSVTQQELNLYKEVLRAIYFIEGSSSSYDEEKVRKLYSDFEWNILMPELVTSLIIGVLTHKEEEMLIKLLQRDSVAELWISKLTDVTNTQYAIEISPMLKDFSPVILMSPTVAGIMREELSMLFSILVCQIIKKLKSSQPNINLRAVADARMIFELEEQYEALKVTITLKDAISGDIDFVFTSENSSDIVKRYF